MQSAPPSELPTAFEYSRDGQVWLPLSSNHLAELFGFLLSSRFTCRQARPLYRQLRSGETAVVFPGRDFEVHIRAVDDQ